MYCTSRDLRTALGGCFKTSEQCIIEIAPVSKNVRWRLLIGFDNIGAPIVFSTYLSLPSQFHQFQMFIFLVE